MPRSVFPAVPQPKLEGQAPRKGGGSSRAEAGRQQGWSARGRLRATRILTPYRALNRIEGNQVPPACAGWNG